MFSEALLERLKSCCLFDVSPYEAESSVSFTDVPTFSLMAVHDDFLYLWHKSKMQLFEVFLNDGNVGGGTLTYKPLLPTCAPPSPSAITAIELSPRGDRLLLVAANSCTVLQLPTTARRRQLPTAAAAGNGCQQRGLVCVSHNIGERFFLCSSGVGSGRVSICQAKWHPHSASSSHVVLLCSDNYLRVFDISSDLDTPSRVVAVGVTRSGQVSRDGVGRVSMASLLGRAAVAFDFDRHGVFTATAADRTCQDSEPANVPVMYILKGNGDLYTLQLDVNNINDDPVLRGPLVMCPSAVDNYDTDACDVLCVSGGGGVSVLIVATPSRLYHCVLLPNQQPTQSDSTEQEERHSDDSWSECGGGGGTLFVYESVELQMSLVSTVDAAELMAPIRLHRSPASQLGYYCSHAFGVHSVTVPLIPTMQRFLSLDDTSQEPLSEQPAVVAHLLCTRSLAATVAGTQSKSALAPVLGLCVAPLAAASVSAGCSAVLLLLLSNQQLLTLSSPAAVISRSHCVATASSATASVVATAVSDAGNYATLNCSTGINVKPSEESVLEHVRHLLSRGASLPVLHSSSDSCQLPCSPQQLQLVAASCHLLRAEYVRRQLAAGERLWLHCKQLRRLRQLQLAECEQLQDTRGSLIAAARALAERYQSAADQQETLQKRVGAVMELAQRSSPALSDAEKQMSDEVARLQNTAAQLLTRVDNARAKHGYQKQRMKTAANAASSSSGGRGAAGSYLSCHQVAAVNNVLAKQAAQIADMQQMVHAARQALRI